MIISISAKGPKTVAKKPKKKDEIQAAGGVVWEGKPWNSRVLLIYRHGHRDWCLPKGKLDAGETSEEAAIREIHEETGYKVELLDLAGEIHYEVKGRPKVVRFWHTKVVNNSGFEENNEVEKIEWFELNNALERMDYETEKSLLRRTDD